MSASGQRLVEAQIRERLDLVDRWRESGLPMRVWAQGQGLEAGVRQTRRKQRHTTREASTS